MKKYLVFESGSRAGLSAELFFLAWRKQNGWKDGEGDMLFLSDSDELYKSIRSRCPNVTRIDDYNAIASIVAYGDKSVFPADELTRQCNSTVREYVSNDPIAKVDELWYYKAHMNNVLSELVRYDECSILIPLTFGIADKLIIKPNRASAGSKGIEVKDGVCVSQRIDIRKEYVVDVLYGEDSIDVFPREVKLRNGYDRYIKLLPSHGELVEEVRAFILCASPKIGLFAPGIFHIQLAEDANGDLFYIEASRRISGTSIVNLANGFNPFCFLNGVEADRLVHKFSNGYWFRYEDFILETENIIRSII